MSILTEIMNKDGVPTMTDISRLLASLGAPGKNQDEKRKVVGELVSTLGIGSNPQGIGLVQSLDSYEEF